LRDVQTGMTSRVSVDSSRGQANKFSDSPSISADGRFIAFRSFATNLISGGTNGAYHIYVHDVVTGETSIVSVDSQGNQGNLSSYDPAISADGSVVSFSSIASNLVSSDTNQHEDVFVHDLPAHVTSLVTTNSNGEQGNADSYGPSAISADGRYVAFLSNASNLAPSTGPHEYYAQAYRRDRATGSTTRQSINEKGQDADWDCAALAISRDGSRLSFASPADNLVSGDEYHYWDVFVRASVSLGLNGIPGSDEPLSFSVSNVRVERQVPTSFLTKSLALVMLSCSGMEGFSLPGGQFVYLSFDPCTTAGLVMHDALSARVDIQGDARTPTVVTPHLPAGIPIYAAAVILDSSIGEAIAASDPIWFTTQ